MGPGDVAEWRRQIRDVCEERGIEATRTLLAEGRYSGRKRTWAQEWLAEKEAEIADQTERNEREIDRDIARAANAIAERHARRANWISLGALGASILALAVSAYAAFREFPVTHPAKPPAGEKAAGDQAQNPAPSSRGKSPAR